MSEWEDSIDILLSLAYLNLFFIITACTTFDLKGELFFNVTGYEPAHSSQVSPAFHVILSLTTGCRTESNAHLLRRLMR